MWKQVTTSNRCNTSQPISWDCDECNDYDNIVCICVHAKSFYFGIQIHTIFTYYPRNREQNERKSIFQHLKRVQTIKTTPPPATATAITHLRCRHQNRNQIDCCKNFIKPREHSLYRNSTIQWYLSSSTSLSPLFSLILFSFFAHSSLLVYILLKLFRHAKEKKR